MRAIVTAMLVVALFVVLGCGKKDPQETTTSQKVTPVVAAKEQKICPLMGDAINKSIYADHEGRRIYFCCPMCVGKFKADPAKYIAIVDAELSGSPAAKPSGSGHEGHEGH